MAKICIDGQIIEQDRPGSSEIMLVMRTLRGVASHVVLLDKWRAFFRLYNTHSVMQLSMGCSLCYHKVFNFLVEKYAVE